MTGVLRECGAVLGEVVLRAIVVLAVVATPVLAAQAVTAGVSFALETFGR